MNRKLNKLQTCSSKLDLVEIIGLTVTDGNGLASGISSDSSFAYIAGCVVVLYDFVSGTQSHLIVSNRSPKRFTSLAVSQDGAYIAAGESGPQPAIIVWSCATLSLVSELKGHRYGVTCTAFSPDGRHLVSVGPPQDGYLCLWDWRNRVLVKKLKLCSSYSAAASVTFSADAKFIFTAGKRHLKIFTVGLPTKSRPQKTKAVSLTMHEKTVNLGHHKGCTFVAITSPFMINGKGVEVAVVYALTDSGVLCLLHGGLTITHSVDLKVEKGYALSASKDFIACACNNGEVKLYTVGTLEHAGGLYYSENKQHNKTTDSFPDAIACQFSTSEKLVVIYRDHSLYIWNIHGNFQATKCCVLVSHSACIWDIKNLSCENMHDPSLACIARGCTGGVSFATCSTDGTIRLWDLALQSVSNTTESASALVTNEHRAITESLGTMCIVGAGTFERESVVSGVITKGYRSMAVSSDGKHLAAGDSDGNLHIFNLVTSEYTCKQVAHEAEILSLNFSLSVKERISSTEDTESYYFLASGGRDRRIHLFDVNRNFDLIASIDDHSVAVSSVKLTGNGHKVASCSSDRSLVFHDVAVSGKGYKISHSHPQKTSHGTIYDISIIPTTETAVAVGQDKKIIILDIATGKIIRSFKQGGDFGDPIKVGLDPSCSYVVCSYSDRSICMYDFMSGEMVARATGHGDSINGIIFLPDCKHLVSVGSDGCIFVWKVPALMTSKMLQRIKENSCPLSPSTIGQGIATNRAEIYQESHLRSQCTGSALHRERKCLQETPTFRFSVSRLPQWAKSKVTSPFVIPMDPISSELFVGEDHSSSKSSGGGNAPVNLALHTPTNHNRRLSTSSSDPSDSKDSTTKGTCRSFALDKRWFTIHTVCLDLLNSPEVYNMKGQIVPLSSDLPQFHALEETRIKLMNNSYMNPRVTSSTLNSRSYYSNCDIDLNKACASGEEFVYENSEQLQRSTSVYPVADKVILNSSNNSAISKPKIEEPNSSARKSYSARFTVRRDVVHGQNLVLDSPINAIGQTMNRVKETNLTNIQDSPVTKQDELERGSSNQQGMISSNSSQNLPISADNIILHSNPSSLSQSTDIKTTNIEDRQKCELVANEKYMAFNACKEALRRLDSSSKTALQVFSRLKDITSTDENPQGYEAEFYVEAAEMLTSIAKNVHEIAKLATS